MGISGGTSFRGKRSTTSSSSHAQHLSKRSLRSAAEQFVILFLLLGFGVTTGLNAQHRTTRVDNARMEVETGTARAIYRPDFRGRIDVSSDKTARRFLKSDGRIGWSGEDDDLHLVDRRESRGGTHLTYRQYVDDVPVFDTETRVSVDRLGKPTFVLNGLMSELDEGLRLAPGINQNEAEQRSAAAVERGDAAVSPAELGVLAGPPSRLVWRTIVWPERGGEWRVTIDAHSGDVLAVEDRVVRRVPEAGEPAPGRVVRRMEAGLTHDSHSAAAVASATGRGMVFDPDPLSTSGQAYAPPYTDADDADISELNTERIEVDLLDISQFADNRYRLIGPHVEVTGSRPSGGTTNYDPPVESDPAGFMYTRGDERFEAVMVYYHIDKAQRRVQELGFSNIQNQPFKINPFAEGNQDASFYYPSYNYIGMGGGGIDDAEDAFVIWHEYGHALLNATVPGMLGSREGTAIHEGWADYWASSYQRELYESGVLPPADWRRLFSLGRKLRRLAGPANARVCEIPGGLAGYDGPLGWTCLCLRLDGGVGHPWQGLDRPVGPSVAFLSDSGCQDARYGRSVYSG